jgi:hypothetical protein
MAEQHIGRCPLAFSETSGNRCRLVKSQEVAVLGRVATGGHDRCGSGTVLGGARARVLRRTSAEATRGGCSQRSSTSKACFFSLRFQSASHPSSERLTS